MLALSKIVVLAVSLTSAVGLSGFAPSAKDAFVTTVTTDTNRTVDGFAGSRDGGAPSNAGDVNGATALLAAIESGHTALVPRLIDLGADVNAATAEGWTPLMAAARRGQPDVVRELLASGADPEAQSVSGWTPLLAAIRGGNEEVVLTLLAETGGETRDLRSTQVDRPVHRAAAAGGATARR